ncbi:alanine--tRNA ligase, partial [candidate division WOR-3 bacterium]|nr:alanine--tRNA ligase [candidate division WOR-3 bacterium]
MDIARNHTATHLLQASLRGILGKHVHQEGSLVSPDRLRFDFTHFSALSKEEINRIETLVNEKIFSNLPVESFIAEFNEAKKMGAIALFDEKYKDTVRVIKISDVSMELCGGTHLERTGEIGLFIILSESSIASGIRRIEALTGRNVFKYIKTLEENEQNIAQLLKVDSGKITERIKSVLENEKNLQHRIEKLEMRINAYEVQSLKPETIKDGINLFLKKVTNQSPEMLRNLADETRKRWEGKTVGVFGSDYNNKAHIVAFVTKDITKKISALDIIKEISGIIKGGGGGRDDFATAGGKDISKVDEAIKASGSFIRKKLT